MKKYITILSLLIPLGVGVGYFIYNKPHQDIGKASSDFKLTATELFASFESNEDMANQKYLDKIIEVSGTVREVKSGDDGAASVILETDDMMFGVSCQLDPLTKHKRTDFKTGEKISLKGKCTGVLMDVVMVRCVEP